jgi:hypothetical protein
VIRNGGLYIIIYNYSRICTVSFVVLSYVEFQRRVNLRQKEHCFSKKKKLTLYFLNI